MKKFNFSLQDIYEIRQYELSRAEAELAKVNSQINELNSQLELIAKQKVAQASQLENETNFQVVFQAQKFLNFLDVQKEQVLKSIAELRIIQAEKKAVVAQAMKKTDALESMKNDEFEEWKDENKKNEAKIIDDLVNSKARFES